MDLQKNKRNVALDDLMPVIREKLDMGGSINLPSTGMSMAPLFHHMRDEVALEAADGRALSKYDMVLYRRDSGQYVLHRIVGYTEQGYILRGDAQYISEAPVRPDQIIARVTGFKRNGREHSCCEFKYRVYSIVWVNTCFIRQVYTMVKSRVGILYYKIFSAKNKKKP